MYVFFIFVPLPTFNSWWPLLPLLLLPRRGPAMLTSTPPPPPPNSWFGWCVHRCPFVHQSQQTSLYINPSMLFVQPQYIHSKVRPSVRPTVPQSMSPKNETKNYLSERTQNDALNLPTSRGVFHGLCSWWHCKCWRSVCAAGGGERELSSTHIHLVNDLYGCRLHVCSTFGWYYICMDGWTDRRTDPQCISRQTEELTNRLYQHIYVFLFMTIFWYYFLNVWPSQVFYIFSFIT